LIENIKKMILKEIENFSLECDQARDKINRGTATTFGGTDISHGGFYHPNKTEGNTRRF